MLLIKLNDNLNYYCHHHYVTFKHFIFIGAYKYFTYQFIEKGRIYY